MLTKNIYFIKWVKCAEKRNVQRKIRKCPNKNKRYMEDNWP